MTWMAFLPILANNILPVAELIWKKLQSNAEITQADWDELRTAANQTAKDRMLKMLLDNGIDPASEQGKLFLALASKA